MSADKYPKHIIAPNGGYCLFSRLQIFFVICAVLKIEEYLSDIPQFSLMFIKSRDAFRPIVSEPKIWMDHKEG